MENFLNTFLLVEGVPTDLVSFTFFIGTMAMMAASAFFFLSLDAGGAKWRTSILVSGLITFIAAVHYYYMRDASVSGESVTFFRYVDWILTVPLMCVEFYLILQKAGAKKSLMWNLILLSVIMLVAGYIGEAPLLDASGNTIPAAEGYVKTLGDSQIWGTISGVAYFAIVYILWFGSAGQLAKKAGGAVLDAFNALKWFVLVGWAIYPIGYMIGTDGWYDFVDALGWNMEVVYNVGDAVNKIGFGLVIYNLAVSDK